AEQGQTDQAQAAYQKAQQADPGSAEALANMGALLRKQGKYAEAAQLLDKAAALNPSDAMVQTLLKDARDAAGTSQDAEKQKRVDALVEELAGRFKRGDVVRPPAGRDDWTSPPLTISLLGFESRGRMPFREGEYDFLSLKIGQALEGQTRARLVERNVMDKLLAELKLSSSALVDPRTALQLGRVLSARLITVGTVAGGGSARAPAVSATSSARPRSPRSPTGPRAPSSPTRASPSPPGSKRSSAYRRIWRSAPAEPGRSERLGAWGPCRGPHLNQKRKTVETE